MTEPAVLLQAAATLPLVGLIWTIQLVHYPLFDGVAPDRFVAYERRHTKRITIVVAPLMLAEVAASAWLLFDVPAGVPAWWCGAGAAMTLGLWLSTYFLQVPLHGRLGERFDAADHRRLVRTNWLRTVLWTLRGGLALVMLA